MKFHSPLIEGKFIKRYKRFFADIDIGQDSPQIVVAHNVNTGTMKTCLGDNWKSLISFHDSPTRKLKYSFEMIHNGLTWIGINTSLTNSLAIEAIKNGTIKELQNYSNIKPEAKIGDSRIDILLSNSESDLCYVEVKNVTLVENNVAMFPDAVTERGQKHLQELMSLKKNNIRAVMLFIVQREDCNIFSTSNPIDKKYSELLNQAISEGVEVLVYQCQLSPEEIKVVKKLPIQ